MSGTEEVLQKLGELDSQWKEADRKRDAEIDKHGVALSETQAKLASIETAIKDAEQSLEKRVDDLEASRDVPLREREGITKSERAHIDAFGEWVRDPRNQEKQAALMAAARDLPNQKAVSTGTPAAGGYGVPEVISTRIGEKLQDISPMRSIVRVVSVGTSDYKELIDVNGESAAWVGETGTRSESTTPQLAEVEPTMGTLYAYPKATEESLDDIFFSVEDWLVRKTATAFAKAEGEAFVDGNGTNKPTGFVAGTPESTGDEDSPARTFGELEYVATGVADALGTPAYTSPFVYPQDLLITLEHKLKPGYRQGAVWLMNKSTLGVVRKWKDSEGNYLWQRSLQMGMPSTLNGYPVIEMEAMPDIGTIAFPIAFGDFSEGYLAVDRIGLRIAVDQITSPGYVKYYVRKRQGGIVYNDDAIKVIKCAAS